MKTTVIEEGHVVSIKLENVRTPKYINEFIRKNCAIELLQMKMFPDAKEITETLGVFKAIKKDYAKEFKYEDVLVIDAACGATPRIAAWVAFNTKWKTIAIDPNLRAPENYLSINNLQTYATKVTESGFTNFDKPSYLETHNFSRIIVVANHAHVSLDILIRGLKAVSNLTFLTSWSIYAVPCCQPLDLSAPYGELLYEYEDHDIWSPKRKIKKYKVY